MTNYNKRHGGPYDRGSADSYYRRPRKPHYYTGDTYNSKLVTVDNMTKEEIEAYNKGYNDNEESYNFKSWD